MVYVLGPTAVCMACRRVWWNVESVVDAGFRLANQMRMLNYCEWMKLVATLFSNLLVILGRVRVFGFAFNTYQCASIG